MTEQLDLTRLNGQEIDRVPAAVHQGHGRDNERSPRGRGSKKWTISEAAPAMTNRGLSLSLPTLSRRPAFDRQQEIRNCKRLGADVVYHLDDNPDGASELAGRLSKNSIENYSDNIHLLGLPIISFSIFVIAAITLSPATS